MGARARQMFQVLRQITWFLKNRINLKRDLKRALSKFLFGILHYFT